MDNVLQREIVGLKGTIRTLEQKIQKLDLKMDQITIFLKMMSDWSANRRSSRKRVTVEDWVRFLEKLVTAREEEKSEVRQSADLVSELVRKGF